MIYDQSNDSLEQLTDAMTLAEANMFEFYSDAKKREENGESDHTFVLG